MRKTAAPSGILLGFLLGMLVWMWTKNEVIGLIAMIGLPIACWNLIRLAEKGLAVAITSGVKGVSNAAKRQRAKAESITQSVSDPTGFAAGGTPYGPASNPMPIDERVAQPDPIPAEVAPDVIYCRHCGHSLPAQAKFCNYCGTPVERAHV